MKTSEQINELATALAAAQAEMRNATLNKINPHFKSKYADLAGIRDAVTPALAKQGLSIVQGTDTLDNGIVVVTRLMHKSGQWIESRFPISYDKPQAMGSAYTYARRYSLSAMCAISADEDDDANAANEKTVTGPASAAISAEQFRVLTDLIEQTGTDEEKLLAYVKADSLETMTVVQFRTAEKALQKKLATPRAEAA